ncbi:hypothetical protein BOQ54_15545 [Chelatococcus daeguensis]|uniref:ABC-2 type transporter transmembrane domain-containing protein n=1 Tax=Chelatococcus daeguensis TaxID=444444 RepID=A0AAC9P0D4_9HYPH|nr:hypothetical protein BOQ54_15545 [Chelatococcus daeguensis]
MALTPSRTDWRRAVDDLLAGFGAWQMWLLLGLNDIRQRYKRSRFGQFWITLSTGIFVAGIGIVYAYLFNHPVDEYIPYLSVNIVFWTLVAGILTDSTTVFTQAGHYLGQQALPKTAFVMRVLVRQLLVLAHNVVIIVLVYLAFGVALPATAAFVLPALVVLLLAAFLAAITIGLLCTRFRDLPQIIQSLLQVAFFLTPIMWRVEQLGDKAHYIVGYNPFAIFLMLVVEPLHGKWPSWDLYGRAFVIIAIMALVAAPLFARFRARIVYWL